MNNSLINTNEIRPAGIVRRLAIILYDTILLIGVLFLAGTILVLLNRGATGYTDPWLTLAVQAYYLTVVFLYFAWFWTRGQTLGMRTWRTYLRDENNRPPSWNRALLRFVMAVISWLPAGLGFWWSVFHPARSTWHDLVSRTHLVVIPRTRRCLSQPTHEPNPQAEEG